MHMTNTHNNRSRFTIFLTLLMAATVFAGSALSGSPEDSVVVKRCNDFKISGSGDAAAWNNTPWIHLTQRSGDTSGYSTRVKILYSGTGIYFLFNCNDKKLTSTMKADNLNLWEEDVVEVFLWPDDSFPVYFEYELSPMNYELPIMVPNYKGNFLGWLPWHYEGERKTRHLTAVTGGKKESGSSVTGWTAEIFIPYKLLTPLNKVPPAPGTRWRANMYRIDYDDGMRSFSWQKTEKTFHDYKKFGTLVFE